MAEFKVARGTQAVYNGLQSKDNDTLYVATDTGNIYLGSTTLFESNAIVAASASGKTITFTKHGSVGTTTTVTLSLSDMPTTAEMTSAISSAVTSLYKFKGSCTYEELPQSGNVVGDVWDVTNEHEQDGYVYPPGTNYAWDGTSWDPLAGKYTQEQADWNENDSTSASYVKNRTHYIDEVGTTYPSVSITLTVSGGYARGTMYGYGQYPEGFWDDVKEGKYLTLTVGDFVFEGEVKSNLSSGFYIGNGYIHMPTLPDTGEDWCYYCDSSGFDSFHLMCDESLAGTYDASVFPNEHVYVPLDERFVPDTITRNSELKNASVAYAHDITPELSDAIEDDTAFIWQTSGGSANIPPKATAVVQSIQGNSTSVSTSCSITYLKSRIYNLFDYENDTVSENYKLDYEAELVADSNYNVYWVHVLAGENGGNNGYVFTPDDGYTLSECGFDAVGVATADGANPSSRIFASTHGNSTSFLPTSDCWLAFQVLKGYEDKICLHFAWSGYNDNVFGAYEEDVLEIPNSSTLRGIGSVCDEIVPEKYIQRIGVGDTKNYTWERWTEEVYDIETQQYVDVFQGWKTTSVTDIALTTNVIMKDYVGNFSSFYTGGGTLFAPCSSENDQDYEQLTSYGIGILYELKDAIETAIQYNGLITVGDFGDMMFDTDVIPSEVVIKYGINYRDTIRNLANSGVTFSSNGVFTSGLFFGQQIVTKNLNGSSSWTFGELKTMMRVVLQGADNTVTLPVGGVNPFRFQIIIVQDSTGGRNLSFNVADSGVIYNPSEFDFTSGEGDQLCICTMIWTGNEYIYECTNYVGGE